MRLWSSDIEGRFICVMVITMYLICELDNYSDISYFVTLAGYNQRTAVYTTLQFSLVYLHFLYVMLWTEWVRACIVNECKCFLQNPISHSFMRSIWYDSQKFLIWGLNLMMKSWLTLKRYNMDYVTSILREFCTKFLNLCWR